jgi:hypothetical protein
MFVVDNDVSVDQQHFIVAGSSPKVNEMSESSVVVYWRHIPFEIDPMFLQNYHGSSNYFSSNCVDFVVVIWKIFLHVATIAVPIWVQCRVDHKCSKVLWKR